MTGLKAKFGMSITFDTKEKLVFLNSDKEMCSVCVCIC